MNELTADSVNELVQRSLEQLLSVSAEPAVRPPVEEVDGGAHLRFDSKSERFDVVLRASEGLLAELYDPGGGALDDPTEGLQALTELTNIFAGEVVLALGGGEELFDLGLPETVDDPGDFEADSWMDCYFDAGGESLSVTICRRPL